MWAPLDIDALWEMLRSHDTPEALLSKHLTRERFEKLKPLKTKAGGTLAHCINAGCHNPSRGLGVYPSDIDAYTTFSELFLPIIREYHNLTDDFRHPSSDFGDFDSLNFKEIDQQQEFIISTRVRIGRTHAGYTFPPLVTRQQLLQTEELSKNTLMSLPGDLAGTYHSLSDLTPHTKHKLEEGHFLFNSNSRHLEIKGGYQFWNVGRGIFLNENKTFIAWVNEEDHLRLISMEQGANMTSVYRRLAKANALIESDLKFAKSKQFGYLTFCASNIGTTLRASVLIKLPLLSKRPDFRKICDDIQLQIRGTYGDGSVPVNDVYDISNKCRLGMTEFSAVQQMWHGIDTIVELEKSLQTQE